MKDYMTNEDEIQESIDSEAWLNEEKKTPQLPEAPASIHIDSYFNGFHVGWTKRMAETDLNKQIPVVTGFVKGLISYGFQPSWNVETNKAQSDTVKPVTQPIIQQTVPGRACPKCGEGLISAKTKTGKPFLKCSANRWNKELGQAEGCDFVEWGRS